MISGVLPALGIVIGALVDRRVDVLGVVVLAGIVVGTVLGLTSHNARLYLLGEFEILQAASLGIRAGRGRRNGDGRGPKH